MNTTDRLDRLKAFAAKSGVEGGGPIGIKGLSPEFRSAKDASRGTDDYIAIANTDDIDLDDEVVVPAGLSTRYIKRNMQLFCDHQYGTTDVVGSIRYFKAYPDPKNHSAWQVRLSLLDTPLGATVRAIIQNTGHIGLSIGFRAVEYGPPTEEERKAYTQNGREPRSIVRTGEWFELSVTPLPCNVSCQTQQAVPADEKRVVDLVELVSKGVIDRACAHQLGIPVGEKRTAFRSVDLATGVSVMKRA